MRVEVATPQISLVSEPNEVSVRLAAFQTPVGKVARSEDDAVAMRVSVFAFTCAVMDEDALPTTAFVFELTLAATDDDAVEISERVASEPESRPAPVRVRVAAAHTSVATARPEVRLRVPLFHISATKVPNDVSVRPENAQMVPGSDAASDDDAVRMAAFVFGFTAAATAVAISPVEGPDEAMIKERSWRTRSP